MSSKRLVCGVGLNDIPMSGKSVALRYWNNMLTRCYNPKYPRCKNNNRNTFVCEEWLTFSNFKKWFDENYVKGYHLDKDLIQKGNRVYSPQYCCFIPGEINTALTICERSVKGLPLGVYFYAPTNRYNTQIFDIENNKRIVHVHDTIESAFMEYKDVRERNIKHLAKLYYSKGEISEKIYNALMGYEVEITD